MTLTNGFVQKSVSFARGMDVAPRGDWRAAADILEGWTDAPFVATTRELHMIQVLGDFDMLVSRQRLTELDPPADFTPDFRTGRPVVGHDAGLRAMLACHRDGLLVTSPIGGTISAVLGCSDT
ncbi:MAG: hypothetical protein AAF264_05945 [Pseudomonadota bacterium]